jgi:hypothetical protein
MTSRPRLAGLRSFVLQSLALLVGCAGFAWGTAEVLRGAAADEFLNLETHVLQFERFSAAMTTELLESPAAQHLSACDNHGQRALLLLEIPLAETALRSGAVRDFDHHVQSLETRSRAVLACAPRDSLAWLVLFGLEVLHGHLDRHSFDLLAASYETSPNEAWMALRRTIIAIPVVLAAPESIRENILADFQNLVRRGFPEIPARAYLEASPSIRALLQSRIEQLDPVRKKAFAEALQRLRT